MHLRVKQDYETKKKKKKKRKNETSRGLHNRISTAVCTSLYFLTLSNILYFSGPFTVSFLWVCKHISSLRNTHM